MTASRRPKHVEGYEEDAAWPALYIDGDFVTVQSDPSLPVRSGRIKWRRWEHGNYSWAYSVKLDDGGSTMALEAWIKLR